MWISGEHASNILSKAHIPQNLRLKRDQVCVKCPCEARDAGRWTRGFRRGGLTRGRGPGYTHATQFCANGIITEKKTIRICRDCGEVSFLLMS